MSAPVRVSAIVPTYNRARLVSRAILSVLGQTYADIELLVVDDGSTDDTEAVVGKYAGGTRTVRYLKKQNGGCASARNRGIEAATGELIAFLDSDDEWLPDAIQSMVDVLLKSGADFVYSPSVELLNEDMKFTSIPAAAGAPEDFAVEHFMTTRARSCSNLYRRRVFDELRFDEKTRYNEDSDLLQRVAINFKAAYSETPTAIVHHHVDNKSKHRVAMTRAVLDSTEAILRDYPEFAVKLGQRVDERRSQLVKELVEALLVAGDLEGARAAAGRISLGAELELYLRLGLTFPLRWRVRLGKARDNLQLGLLKTASALRRRILPR